MFGASRILEVTDMALTDDVIEWFETKAPDVWGTLSEAPALSYEFVANDQAPTLIVEGQHLTSSYDRRFEAFHQAQRVPEGATRATVYGVALGDVVRELLQRDGMEQVQVVVLNPRIAMLSFTLFDPSDWLFDERVSVHLGEGHASPTEPFAVSPVCLKLASPDNQELASLILSGLKQPLPEAEELVDTLEMAALSFIHGVDSQGGAFWVSFVDRLTEVLAAGQPDETIRGFLDLLDVTVKAQERKDFMLVSDLLLYEFRQAIAD
jgi:hypothetical protein